MWTPLVTFLLITNIFKASCEGKGSLTLVIDDTLSMMDDIDQVKNCADNIMNIVFNEKSSDIENLVVVTVNDPSSHLQTVTKSRDIFKETIASLYAHNEDNTWCEEPTLQGVIMALENSLPNSYIYVFTDASASDYLRNAEVKQLCQSKQSQVTFVLTGHCYGFHRQDFQVYYDLADACSGQAFYIRKNEIPKAIKTIEETIKGKKTMIKTATALPEVSTDVPFIIDDKIEYSLVFATGQNVEITVSGPTAEQQRIMWSDNGKVIKLINPTAGRYVATVRGHTKTSVLITGKTHTLDTTTAAEFLANLSTQAPTFSD